jgi:hypothetical protein
VTTRNDISSSELQNEIGGHWFDLEVDRCTSKQYRERGREREREREREGEGEEIV